MKRRIFAAGILLALGALALGAAACGDDDDSDGGATPTTGATEPAGTAADDTPPPEGARVSVELTEYTVLPDPATAAAGSVTFTAYNVGGIEHELVVIKTDLAPDALPTGDDGSVDESGSGIDVIGEIEEFAAGGSESQTFELDAGAYVLICNVVDEADGETTSHYAEGMRVAFTVQ